MKKMHCKWFLLVAALCLVIGQVQAANILTNPGFETGDTTGWTADTALTVVSTQAHSGTYSCYQDEATTATDGLRQVAVPAELGAAYWVTAYVKLAANASSSLTATTAQLRAVVNSTTLNGTGLTTINKTGWTLIGAPVQFLAQPPLSNIDVYVEVTDGWDVYVDDVAVGPMPNVLGDPGFEDPSSLSPDIDNGGGANAPTLIGNKWFSQWDTVLTNESSAALSGNYGVKGVQPPEKDSGVCQWMPISNLFAGIPFYTGFCVAPTAPATGNRYAILRPLDDWSWGSGWAYFGYVGDVNYDGSSWYATSFTITPSTDQAAPSSGYQSITFCPGLTNKTMYFDQMTFGPMPAMASVADGASVVGGTLALELPDASSPVTGVAAVVTNEVSPSNALGVRLSISGTDASQFSVANSEVVVAAGSSSNIEVTYTPTANNTTADAMLTVTLFNAANVAAPYTVQLHGITLPVGLSQFVVE